jgi:hypothetical protein
LWLAFFIQKNIFEIHQYCGVFMFHSFSWSNNIPLDEVYIFYIHWSIWLDVQSSCFSFLAVINNAAINIHVQVFCDEMFQFLLGSNFF